MNQVTTLLDSFSELTGRFCSWFVALMTLITCVVVVMRYGLDLGSVLLQDVVLYLHGALFLLGSSFALKRDAHVRVDIFYREFSDKRKAFVDLVGHCLFYSLFVGLFSSFHGVLLNFPGELWRSQLSLMGSLSCICKKVY